MRDGDTEKAAATTDRLGVAWRALLDGLIEMCSSCVRRIESAHGLSDEEEAALIDQMTSFINDWAANEARSWGGQPFEAKIRWTFSREKKSEIGTVPVMVPM